MRDPKVFFAVLSLAWLSACAQNAESTRKTNKSAVAPEEEETKTKSGTKKDKKSEKVEDSQSTAKDFCGAGKSPDTLKADPDEKVLKVSGSSTSICDLFKDSDEKVLLFQLVATGCDGCADKVFRTKNFLSLSKVQSAIRHLALFSESSEPSGSDISSLAVDGKSVANDAKELLADSFSSSPEKDGTSFLLLSRKGKMETFSGEQYLEAIKKAEDLARAAATNIEEQTPDALKASSAAWDGTSARGNKRFALIATE